jgi:hypothetical protein
MTNQHPMDTNLLNVFVKYIVEELKVISFQIFMAEHKVPKRILGE